ncbi:radical SAM peptide maturase [Draconibacterium orientale]|uniref:radical SAM peptide maturase n=1 Tax=Draconibacterium orientale TaxID=1168034 RepID=UPI0029C02C53|nr:radical SAM peptide maturase [Draconibacterium orientale]
MNNIISLDKEKRYKYSSIHKSLIYWPHKEDYELENSNYSYYKEALLNLYETSTDDEEISFIDVSPQMIQNAFGLTNQVIFEVTERCNLSCEYCALGETYNNVSARRYKNMEWQTAKTVLDFYITKWNNITPRNFKKYFYIGFHGGEPLLNMPLVQRIIDYIEENVSHINFLYSMTTNGTLLNKHIEYLVEKNFLLNISMDGDMKMNSYRIYNNGNEIYNDLFSNLKKIQTKYPGFFKENVEFISVQNNRNTDEGILTYFDKEFGKTSEIHPLSSSMIANYDKWNSMRRKNEEIEGEESFNDNLFEYMRLFSGNFYTNYRSLLDTSRKEFTPTGTCIPFSLRVFVTVRKTILSCERVGFDTVLGKVTDGGVEIDYEKIANLYNNIFDKFKSQCKNCYKKESCVICFLLDKRYFEENFTCENYYPIGQLKKCIEESLSALRKKEIPTNI